MVHAIMQQMAALAQRPKIAQPVDRGVVVQMRSGQNHLSLPALKQSDQIRRRDRSSPSIKPMPRLRMLPKPPGKDLQDLSMRSATPLAHSPSSLETHLSAQLGPVGRIKRFQFWSDWHFCFLAQKRRLADPGLLISPKRSTPNIIPRSGGSGNAALSSSS